MAYLAKGTEKDLEMLASELGLKTLPNYKIIHYRNAILQSKDYDEEFCKERLTTIINFRKEEQAIEERRKKETLALEEQRRIAALAFEKQRRKEALEETRRKDEMRRYPEKLKYETEAERNRHCQVGKYIKNPDINFQNLIEKFNPDKDIRQYLLIFECQARRVSLPKEEWVKQLLVLLPWEMRRLILREPEEKGDDYDYVKELLLKTFSWDPERYRQQFVSHQKGPTRTWNDFYFELCEYFEGWISALKITTLEEFKNLFITDQMKKRVPADFKDRYCVEWGKFISPTELSEKLDNYECVENSGRTSSNANKIKLSKPMYSNYQGRYNTNKIQKEEYTAGYYKPNTSKHDCKMTYFSRGKENHNGPAYPSKRNSQRRYIPEIAPNSVNSRQNSHEKWAIAKNDISVPMPVKRLPPEELVTSNYFKVLYEQKSSCVEDKEDTMLMGAKSEKSSFDMEKGSLEVKGTPSLNIKDSRASEIEELELSTTVETKVLSKTGDKGVKKEKLPSSQPQLLERERPPCSLLNCCSEEDKQHNDVHWIESDDNGKAELEVELELNSELINNDKVQEIAEPDGTSHVKNEEIENIKETRSSVVESQNTNVCIKSERKTASDTYLYDIKEGNRMFSKILNQEFIEQMKSPLYKRQNVPAAVQDILIGQLEEKNTRDRTDMSFCQGKIPKDVIKLFDVDRDFGSYWKEYDDDRASVEEVKKSETLPQVVQAHLLGLVKWKTLRTNCDVYIVLYYRSCDQEVSTKLKRINTIGDPIKISYLQLLAGSRQYVSCSDFLKITSENHARFKNRNLSEISDGVKLPALDIGEIDIDVASCEEVPVKSVVSKREYHCIYFHYIYGKERKKLCNEEEIVQHCVIIASIAIIVIFVIFMESHIVLICKLVIWTKKCELMHLWYKTEVIYFIYSVNKENRNKESFDELKVVKIRCGNSVLINIYDSGAQISVIQARLVNDVPSEGERKIEIASAFGERKTVPLRIIEVRIVGDMHRKVPITCAISNKLVSDMLGPTAYGALNSNIVLYTKADPIVDTTNISNTEIESVEESNNSITKESKSLSQNIRKTEWLVILKNKNRKNGTRYKSHTDYTAERILGEFMKYESEICPALLDLSSESNIQQTDRGNCANTIDNAFQNSVKSESCFDKVRSNVETEISSRMSSYVILSENLDYLIHILKQIKDSKTVGSRHDSGFKKRKKRFEAENYLRYFRSRFESTSGSYRKIKAQDYKYESIPPYKRKAYTRKKNVRKNERRRSFRTKKKWEEALLTYC